MTISPIVTNVSKETKMIKINNKYKKHDAVCHDCGVKEGELHESGCDVERCHTCGQQVIVCYEHCFHEDGTIRQSFTDSRREVFIHVPLCCAVCLEPYPEFFRVDDNEWKRIPIVLHDKIVCRKCYDFIIEAQNRININK